jgi:outer membrane protein assembly factor BamA
MARSAESPIERRPEDDDMKMRSTQTILLACALASLLLPAGSFGQGIGAGGAGGSSDARIEGRYKIVPLPYLNYSRSLGWTFGALPMVMFNPVEQDTISPSSVAGLLGMYTTNDTWFGLGFSKVYFDEDTWRVAVAGGKGSFNFQFYLDNPIDLWVPYNARGDFAYAEVQRRIVRSLYGGVNYVYMHVRNSTDLFPQSLTTTLNGLGLKATMDTRSNVYYPRSGTHANLEYTTYPEAFGNDVASNTIDIDYNHFWSFRQDRDVLAARAFAGLGIGDLAFSQQYIVGRTDIRGYTQGAHRGNYLLAVQGEYRWNFFKRWGAVGFAGLATVLDSLNEADDGRILPGIGAGIRFTAFTDNNMNVGLDIAAGDGDWGVYFRIGEAF